MLKVSGGDRNFHFAGNYISCGRQKTRESGGSPQLGLGSPWRSTVRAPGERSLPETKALANIAYTFSLQKRSKSEKFRTIRLLTIDQYVSRWGGGG